MAFFDTTWYINFGNGSTTGYYAVTTWPSNTAVSAGTIVRQSAAPSVGNERCFVAVVGGTTTNGVEPTWVVTRGAKTTDNTVTWQECTGMPGTCGDLVNSVVWITLKNKAVTLGQVIYDSVSGSLQIVSTAGTSGNGSAPSFSATAGATTADNTITWTSLGPVSNYTTSFKYPHARGANAFAANWGAAGNSFFISNNHAETQAASLTWTIPGSAALPSNVYCVTDTAAPPTTLNTTATITTTGNNGIGFSGVSNAAFAYYYGLNFNAASGASGSANINIGANQNVLYFENCAFNLKTTNSGNAISFSNSSGSSQDGNFVICKNCTFSFGNTSQAFQQNGQLTATNVNIIGGSIAASGSAPVSLFIPGANFGTCGYQRFFLKDVDLSSVTGNLLSANSGTTPVWCDHYYENCKLGSGVSTVSGTGPGNFQAGQVLIRLHNSDSTNTNYRYLFQDFYLGTISSETTVVRTGSLATDGTTPTSWRFVTTANSSYPVNFLGSEVISQWNDNSGVAKTATVYLTTNTTLNNNDFWAEIEYLSSSGSPLGANVNSRMTPLATPIALTTDNSTWGGSITNKYKIALSFTPQMKGPIRFRFYLAKPSVTVYVDPYIYIT